MGKGLDALLDLYNKEGEELATTHARLLLDLRNRPHTQRYGHHTSFEKGCFYRVAFHRRNGH